MSLAQMAGAFVASAVVYATYREAFDAFDGGVRQIAGAQGTAGIFATYPQPFLSIAGGFVDQVVGTALADGRRPRGHRSANNAPPAGSRPCSSAASSSPSAWRSASTPATRSIRRAISGPRLFTAVAGWGGGVFTAAGGWWWVPVVAPMRRRGRRRGSLTICSSFEPSSAAVGGEVSRFVLALDQGTTSSRAIVFDRAGNRVDRAAGVSAAVSGPGHVEHDPEAIWSSQLATAREAIAEAANITAADLAAIGDHQPARDDGAVGARLRTPIANAIVWQSRITAPICDRLKAAGHEATFRRKTGLVVDAYFSGTKIKHLLDSHDGLRARAARGEILFGTIDTFLIWRLTGGKLPRHRRQQRQPHAALQHPHARVGRRAAEDSRRAARDAARGARVERGLRRDRSGAVRLGDSGAGIAGDQQAALFGQACFEPGSAKNTYGTGCFMLLNTGETPVPSHKGLLTTVALEDRRSRRRTRSKARCSSPARPCNGCATG